MKKPIFLNQRSSEWSRFETLLRKTESGRRLQLSGDEIAEYSRLYRAVCYDLSTVRSRDWGRDLERFLNDLVVRGHNSFYRSPPGRIRTVFEFFFGGFPRLLRKNLGYFLLALALFTLPGLISGILVGRDPGHASRILPGSVLYQMEEMYGQAAEREGGTGVEAGMAGFYVHNNVGIAFRCFATGIFFGLGTLFFLIYNSIFLGTITGYVVATGHSQAFFSFVVSHGAFELTAIVIAGAAGLILGDSLLRPGNLRRRVALQQRGIVGVKLAAGAAGMLGAAALIEAFWSPSSAPAEAKYLVGLAMWALVALYLTLAGRERLEA